MAEEILGRWGDLSVNRPAGTGLKTVRLLSDGSQVLASWQQALVFEGRVFGAQAGNVTTPIAGHAAIDADQPELAVYFASTSLVAIPFSFQATMETGATTLAQGGMMCAVSKINVAIGTSTAVTPYNYNPGTTHGVTTGAAAAAAYTGNGTDPLTAGNFQELDRVSAVIDADAATSGIIPPTLIWPRAASTPSPMIDGTGSFLIYGEAAANTLFARIVWCELPATSFR